MQRLVALVATIAVATAALAGPVAAQIPNPIQQEIIEGVLTEGFWADNAQLSANEMVPVVAEWGGEFAFAITDRSLEIAEDPDRNAAALLAQSTLDQLVASGGPETLFLVTGSQVGGASTHRPFLNLMTALEDFDRSDPEASFAQAAATAAALGSEVVPLSEPCLLYTSPSPRDRG